MRTKGIAFVAGTALAVAATFSPAQSEVQLPETVSWSVFDVGAGSYQEAVAQAGAFKKRYGIDLRLIPARNDVSRMAPLRGGQVHFSAMGAGVFFAHEGMFDFGTEAWGPQEAQVLALNLFPAHIGFFVSENSEIKTPSDLRGKRVPWVRGAPSLQEVIRGYLAFAGLTIDDVRLVEVAGFGANLEAFLQGQTDITIANTLSPVPQRAHASPRGPIRWPAFAHDDREGWQRLQAIMPYTQKITTNEGTGVSPNKPLEGVTWALPIIVAYPAQDAELVYNMTRAIHEAFPDYRDAVPSIRGFELRPESLDYPMPFHAGAIRYYQEIRMWTEENEARNHRLLDRQRVLQTAWKEHKAKDLRGEDFRTEWVATRARALRKAGHDPIWE